MASIPESDDSNHPHSTHDKYSNEISPHHNDQQNAYPPIVDGKRDYSQSPAQLSHPGHTFDSNVTICYRDVNVKLSVPKTSTVRNILSPVGDLFNAAVSCGASCQGKDLYRIKDVSGIIRPGTMTLVLSGPGEGKSSYLRALANRIPLTSGRVVYNGRTYDDATREGVDLTKMTQYVDQVDTHLPLLTVEETLDFSHRMTSIQYDPQRVEDTITLLGLEECRNTIIGNALIRGVSGGQRKRVTTGELLVSDASVLFLDEYSNGLDSSTAEDIAKGLKKFCQKYNSSIVATLQQPTPELFALFDRLVVLREGQVVFDGPGPDVVPYFAAMGFKQPDDIDTADFLIDCLSQPRSVILRQREEELHRAKSNKSSKRTNKLSTVDTSYGPIPVLPQPCITTEEMVDYYRTTPHWKEIEEELNHKIPIIAGNVPSAPLTAHEISKLEPLTPTPTSQQKFGLGYRLPIPTMLHYVVGRQWKLFIRNTSTAIPRLMMAIFMSLLYGSLYWNIEADNYILRLAALVIAVTQVAFGNFIEIPVASFASRVVKKQMAARFYPSWTYCVAATITSLPMSFIEAIIYTLFLYFMTNAVRKAAEFFIFLAVLIMATSMLGCWFRFLASIGGDEATSQSLAGPSTGIFTVFGGLFISRSSIPNFMIWLYWISPFSWLVRALANNEFMSSRYDSIVSTPTGPKRSGDLYLETLDFFIGTEWIGYAAIFLIGTAIIIVWANSLMLRTRYYEESIGTRRSDEAEIIDGDFDQEIVEDVGNDDELLKAQVTAAALQQAQIQHEQSQTDAQSAMGGSSTRGSVKSSGATSSYNPNVLKTLRENLPFTPAWMSFSDISYTVKVEKDKQMVDRVLLNHVNGYAQPGKMLALMGASGAGKTTLLDVIAGLKNTGVVDGKILINGQPATKSLIASLCGYVEQFDSLFPYSTVRETLLFAARLRLPRAVSDETKNKIVDEIMDILDLTSMQDYIIGDAKTQGLSPAQCKRVNIGVELVANPSIIFLDEPTTGLDSKSAITVMKVVKRISRSGRAIICTIHQPSAELFFLFDRLLLLGAGGYQIYFGDVGRRAQGFVKYLSRCPGITPIKPRVNPASWMLVELGVGVAAEKGDTSARFHNATIASDQINIEEEPEWASLSPAQRTVQKFVKMYLLSEERQKAVKRIAVLESIEIINPNDAAGLARHQKEIEMQQINQRQLQDGGVGKTKPIIEHSVNTSRTTLPTTTIPIVPTQREGLLNQFLFLYARNFMSYWRNGSFIYARLLVVTILSIIFGLIYLQLEVTNLSSVTSLIGATFMGTIFSAVTSCTTALPNFFATRPTFYREKAAKYYAPTFWALCQLTIEMVFSIPSLIATVIPVYFMVGLENDAGVFFQYCLATYLLILVYVTIAMCLASISPNSGAAGVLQGAFMSFQSALSGIAITRVNVPKGYIWLYEMLPGSHIFQALIMPQFKGNNTVFEYPSGADTVTSTVRDYVSSYLGWGYNKYWESLGWVLLFVSVLQIITFLATTFVSFNKR
jgi:ABC-type multidrug transport system ATPase subunit/ABC-type multidrug transport system permease subunit